jgi:hypothetical protein
MKYLLLALLFGTSAYAVPVLNENIAAEGALLTIWPDHKDPNHFYFAPNLMEISQDRNQNLKFHLTEFYDNCRLGRCTKRAMLNTFFIAAYREHHLKIAQEGILKKFPKARFSPIPFLSSKVEFGRTLTPFVKDNDCAPKGGQAADEVPCSMVLNYKGINTLVPYLNEGKIVPFRFLYKIAGVLASGDGTFQDEMIDYSITVNLGGEKLINHQDLNQDMK